MRRTANRRQRRSARSATRHERNSAIPDRLVPSPVRALPRRPRQARQLLRARRPAAGIRTPDRLHRSRRGCGAPASARSALARVRRGTCVRLATARTGPAVRRRHRLALPGGPGPRGWAKSPAQPDPARPPRPRGHRVTRLSCPPGGAYLRQRRSRCGDHRHGARQRPGVHDSERHRLYPRRAGRNARGYLRRPRGTDHDHRLQVPRTRELAFTTAGGRRHRAPPLGRLSRPWRLPRTVAPDPGGGVSAPGGGRLLPARIGSHGGRLHGGDPGLHRQSGFLPRRRQLPRRRCGSGRACRRREDRRDPTTGQAEAASVQRRRHRARPLAGCRMPAVPRHPARHRPPLGGAGRTGGSEGRGRCAKPDGRSR